MFLAVLIIVLSRIEVKKIYLRGAVIVEILRLILMLVIYVKKMMEILKKKFKMS